MARHCKLAAALILMITTVAAQAGPFIRVDEDLQAARLQTAVTRYERDGVAVDLIGAIHIADKEYYETLNRRFEDYETVLFEMVGGEELARPPDPPPAEVEPAAELAAEPDDTEALAGLQGLYDTIANFLKLSGQMGIIDYQAKNFVHADLTHAEFEQMQAQRGESLAGFALQSGRHAKKQGKQPNAAKLLLGVIAGKPNLVKLELVHTLSQGDDQIAALTGETVIITDRNRRCVEVMERQLEEGRRKLGIFYGAAHFPDMEKRLLELGFRRTHQEWLTAWDVPKRQPKAAKNPASTEKEAA